MEPTIKPGQRCVYVGLGDGHGVNHTITSVSPDMVTTWGDSFRATGGGDTWAGPPLDFAQQFRPLTKDK